MDAKKRVVVIIGATASGKTAYAVELAKKIGGVLVGADSMQIYQKMDIGTAKPTKKELCGVEHFMINIVPPNADYSVQNYVFDALKCIDEITKRGLTPIIVGGTGLYVRSILFPRSFCAAPADAAVREKLANLIEQKGNKYVYEMLEKIDAKSCEKISVNDRKRIIRALEIYELTGKTKTELNALDLDIPRFDHEIFMLNPSREILYERIEKRVDLMIENGLKDEVYSLREYRGFNSMNGIGYKEMLEHIDGEISLETAVAKIKKNTRNYAKRQLTFFRQFDAQIIEQ